MLGSPDEKERSLLEQWIIGSREGDELSLNQLAEYLLPKAFEFANRNILNLSPMDDFEDVAISAVKSVCVRLRRGQTEFFGERELGQLLKRFVYGKIRDRRKYHFAGKRNVNRNVRKGPESDSDDAKPLTPIYDIGCEKDSIWLDDQSKILPVKEQTYLESMLEELGADVQGLFAELVKRLDEKPRTVLMLLTTQSMSNNEIAAEMDCAPKSVERYRQAIRRKLEEIVNE